MDAGLLNSDMVIYRHLYRQKRSAFTGAGDALGLRGGYSSPSIVNDLSEPEGHGVASAHLAEYHGYRLKGLHRKLKSRSHTLLFTGGNSERRGNLGPLSYDGTAAFDDRVGRLHIDPKIRSDGTGQIEIHRVVSLADVELQAVRIGHGVHVIRIGQTPPFAGSKNESVIAQMIVGVGNE